ncbi:MAG: ice-binding family protein [Candidatus Saccharimonadaceae bacterium]
MRNKILNFAIIASILSLGACSNNLPNDNEVPDTTGNTITLTASMPVDDPATRVDLTQDGKDIKLTWVVGDMIQLAFTQEGSTTVKEEVEVTSISNAGKTGHFNIPIPTGWTGSFKLYGTYGGGGIDITGTNPVIQLPTNASSAGELTEVEIRKDVMLYFEHEMQTTSTQSSVVFKHLGSLFSITFKIDQAALDNIIQSDVREVRLVGVGGDGNWAYNVGNVVRGYDLVSGEFLNPETAVNYISFNPQSVAVAPDVPFTVWCWYPLLSGKLWPELELQIINSDGVAMATSNNTKIAKTTAPVAGKTYHFNAEWNDVDLNFVPFGPGKINLGSAMKYSILTKSGITTTGITSIQGDIGVSPAASTELTGFGTLIMNTGGKTSRTENPTLLTGEVYAANYASPTPSELTVAIADMENAFTTANGLVRPAAILNEGAGNISGLTLKPGLYKWGTEVTINSGAAVTLSGGPNDTWVFQIASDFTLNSNAQVMLIGGAKAENITWVVAGQTVLGTGTVIYGNILSKTLISLNTGAKVTGRLYAQTAVTMIAATINKP